MVLVGLAVGICGYFYVEIFGIGYNAINHILANALTWKTVLILLVMKFILVPLVLNSGGFGGIFAPSLFIGACFGYLFAVALNYFWGLNLDTTTFVLVSMGAVLGGVNSIPISAILIIFEMTKDYTYILPLMLSVVISTMIVQVVLKGSIHVQHLEAQGYRISYGRDTSILRSINVEEVMRKDYVLLPEQTTLPELVSQLMESPHGTFYVVNESGKLSGIITENELRPIIMEYEHLQRMLVASDITRPEIVTIKANEDLHLVMKLFGIENVDEIPVVSETDPFQIIGTISRHDVIEAYNKESLKHNLADGLARELKTIKETLLTQWPSPLILITRNYNTSCQIPNGTCKLSNKRDSKSFKNKELPLPQMTALLVLTTQDALNHLPKKLKVPNGNTVDLLKEKKSATLQSLLHLSHHQSTFPLI